jgi:gas vesicle protein
MTQWWELTIPVVGTALGAVIGASTQLLTRRAQSKHDRDMKVLDQKLAAYGAVTGNLVRLRIHRQLSDQAQAAAAPVIEMEPDSVEKAERKIQVLLGLKDQAAEGIGIVREFANAMQPVFLIAPKRVRNAATEVLVALEQGKGIEEAAARLDDEIRRDIGTG